MLHLNLDVSKSSTHLNQATTNLTKHIPTVILHAKEKEEHTKPYSNSGFSGGANS
jgi:hypothetical protein